MSSALPMKKDELSELFKLASLEKKKKLEEKLKIKRQTKVFEDWLYSDKTKKKQIIDEHVDKNVKKIVKVEPKQDLIEQSLGLLAEPSDVKQVSDPLTPIDQNFATLDDLQNHYKLFLDRIQQQLSTLGGGGAINIKDMEDVDLLTAEVNDKYLKYDSSSKKWVGADTSGGGYVLPVGSATTLGGVKIGSGLSINGSGVLSATGGSGISNVVEDTSPELGGNLNLNNKVIYGTGGINITGVSTFASAIDANGSANIVGGSTLDQLNVTGVSTFAGNLNANSGLDVTGNITGTSEFTLTSTDDTNNAAPIINLYRNSASPDNGDYLGQIKFQGESDTGVTRNYAKLTAKISDASNGTEDGILEFAFLKNGSQNICARFKSTEFMLMNGTNLSVDGSQIDFNNIPTSDPGVAGRLWRDGTDLKISVG